jgi:hypothetical protein
LNSCGEKEWCNIYNASGCNSWAKDIELVPGGGYIALIDRWKSGEEERIWLFRLDSLGYVVWAQAYATDPHFWSERSHSLLRTTDSCFVVTGEAQQHPETTKLKVYPNPAEDRISIEMPKYLVRKSGNQGSGGLGITATTIYHQWKEVRLEVFDLFGKLMHSETVPQQRKSNTLDIASWPAGMYVTRVVFMNEVVAREKFVVE